MVSIFALLTQTCGLSLREAAALHGVRLDTVKSWSAGRNPAPDAVLADMAKLAGKIARAADEALEIVYTQKQGTSVIELGISSDDAEAQALGWPCVGAHRAVLALIVARGMMFGYRFEIVPRGSTSATAAAADSHGR